MYFDGSYQKGFRWDKSDSITGGKKVFTNLHIILLTTNVNCGVQNCIVWSNMSRLLQKSRIIVKHCFVFNYTLLMGGFGVFTWHANVGLPLRFLPLVDH